MRIHLAISVVALMLSSAGIVSAAQTETRGIIVGNGGGAITAIGSPADETTCTRNGGNVVTREGKKYCGKPLDGAGEALCKKQNGRVITVNSKKYCDKTPPQSQPSRAPSTPGG